MIVGEHTRDNDLEVNVVQGKKLAERARVRQGREHDPDAAHEADAGEGA